MQAQNQFFGLDLSIVSLSGFVKKEGESFEDCSANNLRIRTKQGGLLLEGGGAFQSKDRGWSFNTPKSSLMFSSYYKVK